MLSNGWLFHCRHRFTFLATLFVSISCSRFNLSLMIKARRAHLLFEIKFWSSWSVFVRASVSVGWLPLILEARGRVAFSFLFLFRIPTKKLYQSNELFDSSCTFGICRIFEIAEDDLLCTVWETDILYEWCTINLFSNCDSSMSIFLWCLLTIWKIWVGRIFFLSKF